MEHIFLTRVYIKFSIHAQRI